MTSGSTLLCETVTAASTSELRQKRDAVEDADLVELRLDLLSDPDAAGALAGRRRPAVVTCRPWWEGGAFKGSEEERRRILRDALACGAEYVDIEWRSGFDDLIASTAGRRIVLSSHDFTSVPKDLCEQARRMRATGAEVVKLAVHADRLSDCLQLLKARSALGQRPAVLLAMGPAGLASRVLASRFRSVWTYAGSLASVGQLSSGQLLSRYRFRAISDTTEVYGVVGRPVGHSVSPAMHNAAFAEAGIDAVYLPLPATDIEDFFAFARGFDLRGASVTIPYKVSMFDEAHEIDDDAQRIGAINTLVRVDGRWKGRNTDAAGFLRPLQAQGVPLKGARVAVLGAGGSARAVAVALARTGARVSIHARNRSAAKDVARLAGGKVGAWPPPAGTWDLLINCTPVGMYPSVDETPVAQAALTGGWVYDLVYNPTETRLLREAALSDCQTLNGLDMLVAQAQEQLDLWTGCRPDESVLRAAALNQLAEFVADEAHHI